MIERPPIQVTMTTAVGKLSLRTAVCNDLPWCERSQARFVRHVGHIPHAQLRLRVRRNQVWILELDGDEAGHLVHGAGERSALRLSQVTVDEALWRNGIGNAALAVLRRYARAHMPNDAVAVAVAEGLPMNDVVRAAGAKHVATRVGKSMYGRRLHHYVWPGRGAAEAVEIYSRFTARLGRALRDA